MAFKSRCMRGSSSVVSSRFASSATRRTSSIVTPACLLIAGHPSSLASHFKVYPAHLHSRDTPHLPGKLSLHAHHLPQPCSIRHLHQNHPVRISDHSPPLSHRLAAGHRPGCRQLVLVPHPVQAAPQRASEQITHSLHGHSSLAVPSRGQTASIPRTPSPPIAVQTAHTTYPRILDSLHQWNNLPHTYFSDCSQPFGV